MYTVLAIDAGGVRGLITARKLEYLEAECSKLLGEEIRVAELFDLFIGTSVGSAICCLYLQRDEAGNIKNSAKSVCEIFQDTTKNLLKPSNKYKATGEFNLVDKKYQVSQLIDGFKQQFGAIILADLYKECLIPVYDLLSQDCVLIDKNLALNEKLYNIVAASCAAPEYFDPVTINLGDSNRARQLYAIDGMMTNYNPALQVLCYLHTRIKDAAPSNILLSSFGLGELYFQQQAKQIQQWELRHWHNMQASAFALGAAKTQHSMLRQIYTNHKDNYFRFNTVFNKKIPDFDDNSDVQFKELNNLAISEVNRDKSQLTNLANALVARYKLNNDGVTTDKYNLKLDSDDAITYPDGVAKFLNIGHYIDNYCSKYGNNYALENMGVKLTYNQVAKIADNICAWLHHRGFGNSDRIAIVLPNCLCYTPILYGILKAGCIAVNINPQYTVRELEHCLLDSQVKLLFIWDGAAATFENTSVAKTPAVICTIGDLMGIKGLAVNKAIKMKGSIAEYQLSLKLHLQKVLRAARKLKRAFVKVAQSDVALFQYTGGTTGVSKAAMLTHANLLSNIHQAEDFLPSEFKNANKPLVAIAPLPLYHIFAMMLNAFLMPKYGVKNKLITNPRDIPSFVKVLNKKFHLIPGVNTLFNALVNNPKFKQCNFKELILIIGGGSAIHSSTAKQMLDTTGKNVVQAYGLTEASPGVTVCPYDKAFNKSIGKPLKNTILAIVDERGNPVANNEVGELLVKGPQVMAGYWRGQLPKPNLGNDRWLLTGDLVKCDDNGYYYIVDRKKDMVLVSGFNVYPNEVESEIVKHDAILDCGCVGVDDNESGQRLKAFVVLKPGKEMTEQQLISWCSNKLTKYKIPKHIQFVKDMPKSNVGKVLRRKLLNPKA